MCNIKVEVSFSTTRSSETTWKNNSATHFTFAGHANFHILVKDPLHAHSFSISPHFE